MLTIFVGLCAGLLVWVPWGSTPPASAEEAPPRPAVVSLTSSSVEFSSTGSVLFTATTDISVGDERIVIWDLTAGAAIGTCVSGSSCQASTSFPNGGPHDYQAFVGVASAGPGLARLESAVITAARAAWAVTLDIDQTTFTATGSARLTAAANQVAGTYGTDGFWIDIWDTTTNTKLRTCDPGLSTCAVSTSFPNGGPEVRLS